MDERTEYSRMAGSEGDAGYTGETDSGARKHGRGVQRWADGSKYDGQFVNDLKEGMGVFTWANGEFYDGLFYKDYRHGRGIYCWPGGYRFVGKFYLNRKEGYGTQYFPDGTIFQGLYHMDERFGPGVLTYADGRQDVGLWQGGRLLKLCHCVPGAFTLTNFPEFTMLVDAWRDDGVTSVWDPLTRNPLVSRRRGDDDATGEDPLLLPPDQVLADARFALPTDMGFYSVDSDHLPVPQHVRADLDRRFFGECSSDANEDLALPLQQRMLAHVHRHRFEAETMDWDVNAVLSGARERFGPKGPQEENSEQLILDAMRGDHQSVYRILINAMVHPDVADVQGHTALLAASMSCQNEVIHLLLDRGADVNKLNDEGVSALAACLVLQYPVHTLHKTAVECSLQRVPSTEQLQVLKVPPVSGNTQPESTVYTDSLNQTVQKQGVSTADIDLGCLNSRDHHSDETTQNGHVTQSNTMSCCTEVSSFHHNEKTDTSNKFNVSSDVKASNDTDHSNNIDTSDKDDHRSKVSNINDIDHSEVIGYSYDTDLNNETDPCIKNEPSADLNFSECAKINFGHDVSEECSTQVLDRNISGSGGTTVFSTESFSASHSLEGFHFQVTEGVLERTTEMLSCTGLSNVREPERKIDFMKIDVQRGWWSTVDLLLTRGADPNASSVPMPALFFAVKARDVQAVRRLLECGACPNMPLPPKCKSLYPLHIAAGLTGPEGPQITELLLHALADPDVRAQDADEVFQLDKDMVDPQAAYSTAHFSGSSVMFTLPYGIPEEGGRTPLHVACQRNTEYTNARDVVRLLLSRKANTSLLWSGHSPLSLAIASGNDLAVDELLAGGADPNLPLSQQVGSALCAVANLNYNRTQQPLCRIKLLHKLIKAGANILMPVVVGGACEGRLGTAVDCAHHSYNQDRHIANSPYHTLSPWEREAYRSRRQLLAVMGELLREAAVRTERERLEQDSKQGVHSISPVEKFLYIGAGAKPSDPQWQDSIDENPALEQRLENGVETKTYIRKPLFRYCYQCGRSVGVILKACSRCHEVYYCSKTCKLKAWASLHREECLRIDKDFNDFLSSVGPIFKGTSKSGSTRRQGTVASKQVSQSKKE